MDAEIWSNADIRNGRRVFFLVVALIVVREIGTGLLSFAWPREIESPAALGDYLAQPEPLRALLGLAFTLLLLLLVYFGYGWARIGLGLVYLLRGGQLLYADLHEGLPAMSGALDQTALLGLANAALGVLIGVLVLFSPRLRAFTWSRASDRLIIPIPGEDEPPRRFPRRSRTMGETLLAALTNFAKIVTVIVILGVGVFLSNTGSDLWDALLR